MNNLYKLLLLIGSLSLVSCGEKIEGQYYSKDGNSSISFEKNNKAYYTVNILFNTLDTVCDYEIDGNRIILKMPHANLVLTKLDNGELKGGMPPMEDIFYKFNTNDIPGTYKCDGEIKFLVTLNADKSGTIGTDKISDPLIWAFSKEKKEIELVSQKNQNEKLHLKVIGSNTLKIKDEILEKVK